MVDYDGLSRVVAVTAPGTTSGSEAVTSTNYAGNQSTVTDPAGNGRSSLTDALGRLKQVIEDPFGQALQTSYTYDALDNLSQVNQGGQIRSFTYDSLKRLTSTTNPESGTVSYTYDGNGNVKTRNDARGVTIAYNYDPLNRLLGKSYNDGTPTVGYVYDTVWKGQLSSVSNPASTTNFTQYDALGRVTSSTQATGSESYVLGYSYNLAGGLTKQTFPSYNVAGGATSGRVVTYAYDGAGRVKGVTGQKGTTITAFASSIGYKPHGPISALTLGNGLVESRPYSDDRLQPTGITVGGGSVLALSLYYCPGLAASCSTNNGNILAQNILEAGTNALNVTQTYTYDKMNRLGGLPGIDAVNETGSGGSWMQRYKYDGPGNRAVVAGSWVPTTLETPQVPDEQSELPYTNNRWNGAGHDNAGNMTALNSKGFTYDAENRMKTATVGTTTYDYDGDGRRVRKISGGVTTVYVYDALGSLAAEYATQPSGLSGANYLTADHLGTTRLLTDSAGAVVARYDYVPFGEEIPAGTAGRTTAMGYRDGTTPDALNQKFTGKERDAETGFDFFDSRYFSSAEGRFTSPDVMMGKPEWLVDPQRWNRYAYVRNNPLKYIDPNGEDLVIYYSLGGDVSDADREWFNKNKAAILSAIQTKFENAGVKNVSLRDQSTLSKDQIAALDKGTPFGVSRLTFVGKEYPGLGAAPQMGVLGYAHPDGKGIAGVFLDTFPKVPPAGCDQVCMAGNVGAHELGHTLGMPHLGFFEEMGDRWRQRPAMLGGTDRGGPDLMTGSMGTPTQPLYFKPGTNERTQRAIEQLNRIGDMTQKK